MMAGSVTLALPGSASAATWQLTSAQAVVVPDSATDAWGVGPSSDGYNGRIAEVSHLSGTTWSTLTVPDSANAAVAADSPTDVWAVGGSSAAHYDGSKWTAYTVPVAPGSFAPSLRSVAIVSPTDVWAAGPNQNVAAGLALQHWDGTKWSQVTAPVPAGASYAGVGVHGLSASGGDLWVLASATVGPNYDTEYFTARWDGTRWSLSVVPTAQGQQPTNISAASATDAWVAGNDYTGFAMHYNGSTWSTFRMPAATGQLDTVNSIAARGDEAWAVGTSQDSGSVSHAAVWHWDGSTWSSVGFPVTSGNTSAQTVSYVPGSNTVWIEADDPSTATGLVLAVGG